uniref:Uncharacterized protein n=1 Tax=Leptobrachium leishanense TaxID=445787 RepID=A0A8C5PK57_9ANUR
FLFYTTLEVDALICIALEADLLSAIITNRSLISLDLSENELKDSGVKHLCEGLRHPDCVLQELGLEDCDLLSCGEDLRSVIITNRSLIKLDLSKNYLEDSVVKSLCEGLMHPDCVLQELGLHDCLVTPSCCEHLYSVIITNRSLIVLDLSMNDLDAGVKRLCEGLRHPGCVLQNLWWYWGVVGAVEMQNVVLGLQGQWGHRRWYWGLRGSRGAEGGIRGCGAVGHRG